ncbi:hydroxypyruvate isomerase family protein [Pseudarthrobacter sp. NamE5]|uniref:hydroxypyruvate isomerase family protein n=1 Tax=Pseudarthrobacter sp. NamE5 TaxID=2576839 RepID=UPI00110B3AD6|nr:TIM barrel protein [Pseudarthrobacter sp. NamE5]TLM80953.1 TIM barrel protein [Pseudarthrobacter sp. NamE5]
MRKAKLAANLKWLFKELDFESRFQAAAHAGFQGVEYPNPYAFEPTKLRGWLDRAGLKQVLINTPGGPTGSPSEFGSAGVPGCEQEFRNGFLSALEYADWLDAGVIHVMAGNVPPEVTRRQAAATLVANMSWALEQAQNTNTVLVMEAINRFTMPRHSLDEIEHAAEIAAVLDSPKLGVLFDVFHVQRSGGNVLERLQNLAPQIAHVQVADSPHRHEPGTGEIAYSAVFDQLDNIGYDGWIGCEYEPTTSTLESLWWRGPLGYEPAQGRAS